MLAAQNQLAKRATHNVLFNAEKYNLVKSQHHKELQKNFWNPALLISYEWGNLEWENSSGFPCLQDEITGI